MTLLLTTAVILFLAYLFIISTNFPPGGAGATVSTLTNDEMCYDYCASADD